MALPAFESLSFGGTLQIPLSLRPAAVEGVELFEGRPAVPGSALASGALEQSHLAIAPSSGECGSCESALLTSGVRVPAIPIRLQHPLSTAMQQVQNPAPGNELLREFRPEALAAWIERFRNAGIHAHRSGSPSLLEQLLQAVKRPIDVVLCSLLDSDPNAPLQALLAATYPVEFSLGVAIVARLTGARRSAVAIGSMPGRWSQLFRERLVELKINEIALTGDYPLSDPTLLLYATLGRKLRPFRLPTEQGAIVFDVAAAIAIGRFVLLDEPMTQVPFALHDWRTRRTRYVIAPVGISIGELLRHYQTDPGNLTLRGGDSLRDIQLSPQSVTAGSELVVHVSQAESAINPDPCIRCGWCVEVCPTGVQPASVLEAAQRHDPDLAERMGAQACIECGLCSFVCPSKLPLLHGIRQVRIEKR